MERRKHKSAFDHQEELLAREHRTGPRVRPDSGVSHHAREVVTARFPVLATFSVCDDLPTLRRKACHAVIRKAFEEGRERPGRLAGGSFRLIHYSLVAAHTLHVIVEAKDRESLARGMQGLGIRIARGLNRLWQRKGTVFADRYDDRALRSAEEVRAVLRDVLKIGCARKNAYSSEAGPRRDVPTSAARTKLLKRR